MIDEKVLFNPINELSDVSATEITGIANQHIDRQVHCANGLSASHNRFELAQVHFHGNGYADDTGTSFPCPHN